MCLLLLALHSVPGTPWLLLGNRDEFHARPTAPAQPWADAADIVGGRDLVAGGSWLALQRHGRYAAVTNVRGPSAPAAARSRGTLVASFLTGEFTPAGYAAAVAMHSCDYGPFNLIIGDSASAYFVSSLDAAPRPLDRGIHAFSNGSREDEWPKMRRLRERSAALIAVANDDFERPKAPAGEHRPVAGNGIDFPAGKIDSWLDLLLDDLQPDDEDLPDTGVGIDIERRLAPIFIRGENYGTRASTLAYSGADGATVLHERRFGRNGRLLGQSTVAL